MVDRRDAAYGDHTATDPTRQRCRQDAPKLALTSVAHLATVLLGCAPKQGSWTYFAALLKATEKRHVRGVSESPMDLLKRG